MAALASAAELNTLLQTTVPDDQATLALATASGTVRGYCGWNLLRETATFTSEGDGTVLLSLPTLRLLSITNLLIDGTVTATSTMLVLPRGQIVWADGWPAGARIDITIDHGYDEAPDVVKLVTLTVAARIVNNPEHLRGMQVGQVQRSYDPKLLNLDMRLLDPYRLE